MGRIVTTFESATNYELRGTILVNPLNGPRRARSLPFADYNVERTDPWLLGQQFGDIAESYGKSRPNYLPDVIDAVIEKAKLRPRDHVLEVGPGTGQASAQLLDRSLIVTAVEADPRMAIAAGDRLGARSDFSLINCRFEEWIAERAYNAVCAFTSFHLLSPSVAFPKVLQALKLGGHLAVICTLRTIQAGDLFGHQAAPLFREVAPGMAESFAITPGDVLRVAQENRHNVGDLMTALMGSPPYKAPPQFGPAEVSTYTTTTSYTALQYTNLLRTYSSLRATPPEKQQALLDQLQSLIDRDHGGLVDVESTNLVLVSQVTP